MARVDIKLANLESYNDKAFRKPITIGNKQTAY